METLFPQNPSDGQLFDSSLGVLYKYSLATNSWARIIRPQVSLATPLSDGLMSVDDYKKYTSILIPPPQITLTAPGCDKIVQGYVGFGGDGVINVDVPNETIHENTGSIKFSLDADALLDELTQRGKFKIIVEDGDQGDPGDRGEDGLDALPVGPYGDDGAAGANIEWPGSLISENLKIKEDNRAVVDVTIKKENNLNYIIVKRANIGNPNACPDTMLPRDVQSPWLLGIVSGGASNLVRTRTDGGSLVCSWSCDSNLYYFNMETIVTSIKNRFVALLKAKKAEKEAYVLEQLQKIQNVFEDQKTAVGCALEKAYSRTRNEDARRFIEQMGIAAAGIDTSTEGHKLIFKPKDAGVVPSFYQSCRYDPITLQDPEAPIVDPDKLKGCDDE